MRVEATVQGERLRQREIEGEGNRNRAEEAEKARRDRSRENARLKVENEDLRRQIEQFSNIKVDSETKVSAENQKYLENFKQFGEQLEKLKEQLTNDQKLAPVNTSFSRQSAAGAGGNHSRHGSDLSKSF